MELAKTQMEAAADTNLEKILNLAEKGSDVIILHPGSQTLKFGLASQLQPFIMPNAIAHRLHKPKSKAPISSAPSLSLQMPPGTESAKGDSSGAQMQISDYVEQTLEQKLAYIEPVLCKLKHITIDQKRPKALKKTHTAHDLSQPVTVNHKPVPYQVYTADNSLSSLPENAPVPPENWATDPGQLISTSINDYLTNNNFSFVDVSGHPDYLVGQAAINVHRNDGYVVQWPLRFGYFNVSSAQSVGTVMDNIEKIFEFAATERLKIPRAKFGQYAVILVIPDLFNKSEVKAYLDILLRRLQFKSAYLQQESVLASFAYALQSACVVDIGAQKTTVCCVDEGAIVPGSIIRRNFGGDDITYLLHRLLIRQSSLHYFPAQMINVTDLYHFRLLERLKEDECNLSKNPPEPVRTCKLWVHEKGKKTTVATFNVSDALVTAPICLFYPDLIDIVNPKYTVAAAGTADMRERDPEDVMQVLIAETLAESGKKADEAPDKKESKKTEESKEEVKDGSDKPVSSKPDDDSESKESPQESSSEISKAETKEAESQGDMNKAMSVAEMIIKSIMKVEDLEMRQKISNAILLVGGGTKFRDLMDVMEERLVEKLSEFSNNIDRVEVVNNAASQKNTMDNRFLSWIGASVIPKIEITKDMFIPKEKWICDLPKYYDVYMNAMNDSDGEEPAQGQAPSVPTGATTTAPSGTKGTESVKGTAVENKGSAGKKAKKEFSVDGGLKLIREKCPFVW